MHLEAWEYVEGWRRGTANLTGSTPGVTHHPASHTVPPSVFVLLSFPLF